MVASVYFLLLTLVSIASTLARNFGEFPDSLHSFKSLAKQSRYLTAYACEGKTLKIECEEGELINLIRANYGRFSITICNDHGNTDWSVNCMSPTSLRVLHARCENRRSCSFNVSQEIFDSDPCPDTSKYLEAHYNCLGADLTTTTNRPNPPWLMTSQPSVWSTAKSITVRPPSVGPQPTTASPGPPTSSPAPTTPSTTTPAIKLPLQEEQEEPETTTQVPVPATFPARTHYTAVPVSSTTLEYLSPSASVPWQRENGMCGPAQSRGLFWNWTNGGEVFVQPCPEGATGVARWRCENGHRVPATPDLSECRSLWLTSLEYRINDGGDSITQIANDLSQVTDGRGLYGGDMLTTTKIMQEMAQKMSKDILTVPDQQQREAIVTELLHSVVKIGSNLLDTSQHASWHDLTYDEQMRVASSLLVGLEENSFLLADTVNREKTVTHAVKNILLSVRVLELRNVGAEVFPSASNIDEWRVGNDNWLQIQRAALLAANNEQRLVRLVFAEFDHLEEILRPQSPSPNTSKIINSKVISASLGKGRHIQLNEPVTICLKHLQTENVSSPVCVYWDYIQRYWSDEGCHVALTNNTHTVCQCNHLTHFAILMDVHTTDLMAPHQVALQIITYIGCIISILCLMLAVITFQIFRGLKCDRVTIHKNLCACLLIAELLFLVGISRTDQQFLCGAIAAALHFFFLCAFAWMFLEGFQLYVMLIEVFEAEKSRVCWYYTFGYGVPLLIVLTSCLIDPLSYGTNRYCWLRADNFFIFSFVGPVVIVILANVVFLSMAIYMMCRHSNTSVTMKSKEHSRLASASGKEESALQSKLQSHLAWLRGAIVLVFLLGLTWTFGLLYLNEESVIMAYIFTVLNSLQGLFIFVFHCVQNDKVRKEYRKLVRQHSWISKCLGCWESPPNVGVVSGKERRASLYAGNNSAPSHSTDSSTAHSHSPHATNYYLHRGWSSRSGKGAENSPSVGTNPQPTNISTHTLPENQVEVCVATLPYVKPCSRGFPPPNIPKSATTWGPLNKPFIWKNIKAYPHHAVSCELDPTEIPIQRPGSHTGRRAHSPWNHTYTEITVNAPLPIEDPVYEEIERERERDRDRGQVSDVSDEDGRRQSDMSRQSSRSYGDHRPLIPYSPSPAADRNFHSALDAAFQQRLKEQSAKTVAVLDGQRVVCHLQPTYMPRIVYPPYSEC
nr:PREDICTED: latrophilin Cirl-like isoform X3 [Bemisia tabaci]